MRLRSLAENSRERHSVVLTIRHGASVWRERLPDLESALSKLEIKVQAVRREGPLEEVSALRRYAPEARVAARLELSNGSLLRRRDAGIDVMGNGELVAFQGGVARRELRRSDDIAAAIEAVRAALS